MPEEQALLVLELRHRCLDPAVLPHLSMPCQLLEHKPHGLRRLLLQESVQPPLLMLADRLQESEGGEASLERVLLVQDGCPPSLLLLLLRQGKVALKHLQHERDPSHVVELACQCALDHVLRLSLPVLFQSRGCPSLQARLEVVARGAVHLQESWSSPKLREGEGQRSAEHSLERLLEERAPELVDLGRKVIQAPRHLLVLFLLGEVSALPDFILYSLEDSDCHGLVVLRRVQQVTLLTLVGAVQLHRYRLLFYCVDSDLLPLLLVCLRCRPHMPEGGLEPERLDLCSVLLPPQRCFLQRPEGLLDDEVGVPEEAELARDAEVLLLRPDLLKIAPKAVHCSLPPLLVQVVVHLSDVVQLLHFHVPELLKLPEVRQQKQRSPQLVCSLLLDFGELLPSAVKAQLFQAAALDAVKVVSSYNFTEVS